MVRWAQTSNGRNGLYSLDEVGQPMGVLGNIIVEVSIFQIIMESWSSGSGIGSGQIVVGGESFGRPNKTIRCWCRQTN